MTTVQFANVCNGTLLRSTVTGIRYRIRQRIQHTLILERVAPIASAPMVEIVKPAQRNDWEIAEVSA